MAIITPNGITTPSGTDLVKIVVDLSAMATSIDSALNKRANHFIGSSSERISSLSSLPNGTFWSDTPGTGATWVKYSGLWQPIHPVGTSRSLILGDWSGSVGFPYINFRNTGGVGATFRWQGTSSGASSSRHMELATLTNSGDREASWRFYGTGQVARQLEGQVNLTYDPYIQRFGSVNVNVPSAGGVGSATVSFPGGSFTRTPQIIHLALNNTNPNNFGASYSNPSVNGFTVYATRATAGTVTVLWHAIQPTSF